MYPCGILDSWRRPITVRADRRVDEKPGERGPYHEWHIGYGLLLNSPHEKRAAQPYFNCCPARGDDPTPLQTVAVEIPF